MKQTKKASLVEVMVSTAIGYIAALATQLLIFPWFDIQIKFSEQLWIGAIFTIVSLIRGYIVRRLFVYIQFGRNRAIKYKSGGF